MCVPFLPWYRHNVVVPAEMSGLRRSRVVGIKVVPGLSQVCWFGRWAEERWLAGSLAVTRRDPWPVHYEPVHPRKMMTASRHHSRSGARGVCGLTNMARGAWRTVCI